MLKIYAHNVHNMLPPQMSAELIPVGLILVRNSTLKILVVYMYKIVIVYTNR